MTRLADRTHGTTVAATWAIVTCAFAACAAGCSEPSDIATPRADALTQESIVVLDSRDGATLSGRLEAVRLDTDAERVIVLGEPSHLAGARALDARFVAGGIVLLGADHVLRFSASGGAWVALDDEAWAPLSVAAGAVAYVRGAPPDLELSRADVDTGRIERLTQGMAPVWSPALSEDGSEIVFVSGVGGTPRLHRFDAAGRVIALAPTTRAPSAPSAPRWSGSTLTFEDDHGVVSLDIESGTILRVLRGAQLEPTR